VDVWKENLVRRSELQTVVLLHPCHVRQADCAGAWPDVPAACAAAVSIIGSTSPDPVQVAANRKAYPLYRELYPALKPGFGKISV
jgi:hypothetical protein